VERHRQAPPGSLDRFKVADKEEGELLAAVSSLKKDIVEKP